MWLYHCIQEFERVLIKLSTACRMNYDTLVSKYRVIIMIKCLDHRNLSPYYVWLKWEKRLNPEGKMDLKGVIYTQGRNKKESFNQLS